MTEIKPDAGQPQSQRDIIALLMRPEAYPGSVDRVERIETHGAIVFLAGERAYKLKRAVKLPYLDFSTLEKRRAVCERELRINRRTAPALYLDAVPVTRDAGGDLHLGGEGEAVDWLVVMRRFPGDAVLDKMAAAGRLDDALLLALADSIRGFHASAETAPGAPWLRVLHDIVATLHETLLGAEAVPLNLHADDWLTALRAELSRREPVLLQRQRTGHVRRCHGDLHLRNIVLHEGRPLLFDALEFDEDLSTIDTLYDLGFLLMDLCHRGLRAGANAVLNRYFGADPAADVWDGLALLPLFLSLRAGIRAMVGVHALGVSGGQPATEAATRDIRDYLALAEAALRPPAPMLVCVGGLSGTGKTTVARALAPLIGAMPGAIHLRSDVERKRLFGVEETARLDASAYTPETGDAVYSRLFAMAAPILRAGHSVIVDAVFTEPERRAMAEQAARDVGCGFTGLWLEADAGRMLARVGQRRGDASDAGRDEVLRQLAAAAPLPSGWARIDAAGTPDETLALAAAAIPASP